MSLKIDFFDDSDIGHAARRLAFCFNQSARISGGMAELKYAAELFRSSTGLDAVPEFTRAEEEYLRLALVETAAIANAGKPATVDELERKACQLHEAAVELGLIKAKSPCCRERFDERHYSFPGS